MVNLGSVAEADVMVGEDGAFQFAHSRWSCWWFAAAVLRGGVRGITLYPELLARSHPGACACPSGGEGSDAGLNGGVVYEDDVYYASPDDGGDHDDYGGGWGTESSGDGDEWGNAPPRRAPPARPSR